MKRRKLKPFVVPSLIMIGIVAVTLTAGLVGTSLNKKGNKENIDYVSNIILDNDVAVINTTTKVINPYTDQSVTIGKYFYDYKGTKENQEKSIVYHDNTYMQNSGIDFVSENEFDVISVLDGTVTDVK